MTIALIDGDVLCYLACEDRNKRKVANTTGLDATSDALADILLYEVTNEDDFTDEENEAYLNKAFIRFQQLIKEICEVNFTEDYQMAVGGIGNFRKDIYPLYKMNRHANPAKRNPFVPLLREMAVANNLATPAHGMEADDLLRIWAEEYRAVGADFVVCSIDKDLMLIEGMHWKIHHKVHFESTKDYAMRFYHEQLLMGDATDNIPGVPGVGPVKAKELLANCVTEKDFQDTVRQVYYTMVHQWRYALQLTGRLIYLKKTYEDEFDFYKWEPCELIDCYEPKKGKRKMEEWTIDSALAAINPEGITGRQRWEDAMAFMMSETEDMPGAFDTLAKLLDRNAVPQSEKDAYAEIKVIIKRKAALPESPPDTPKIAVEFTAKAPPALPIFPKSPTTTTPPAFSLPQAKIETPAVSPTPSGLCVPPTFDMSNWKRNAVSKT